MAGTQDRELRTGVVWFPRGNEVREVIDSLAIL